MTTRDGCGTGCPAASVDTQSSATITTGGDQSGMTIAPRGLPDNASPWVVEGGEAALSPLEKEPGGARQAPTTVVMQCVGR